jgi:hypothetical protein
MSRVGRTYNDLYQERSILIDTSGKSNKVQYQYSHEIDGKNSLKIDKSKILYNIQEKTVLNTLFFSDANIENLQKSIIYNVWKKTGKRISKQNYNDLIIIMRSTFLLNSKNLNYNITEQIRELNNIVIAETVPHGIKGLRIDSSLGF